MRKKMDIVLDFTSLLDVTLILIFFFILFSHFESENNAARTDEKVNELNEMIEEAKDREAYANELAEQLQKDLNILREYDSQGASNVEEMMEYAKSSNLKFLLEINEDDWILRIAHDNKLIAEIVNGENMGSEIQKILSDMEYGEQDTIFCDFIFDGSLPGTRMAYKEIMRGIQEVRKKYKNFYYSETDLSVGKD